MSAHNQEKTDLTDRAFAVAGGTGNVGSYVVGALLERGARVAVPSRSRRKLERLSELLAERVGQDALSRLHKIEGVMDDERSGEEAMRRIREQVGSIDGALASLGRWHQVNSLLEASVADFEPVLDGYLRSHFAAARTFLREMRSTGGVYVTINGPLAFDIWPGSNASLVSIVTAAQHMLFRAFAQEMEESEVDVVEVVSHAFIREHTTQPGSPLTGEDVGAYAAHLLSGGASDMRGTSIRLKSPAQLKDVGVAA